jgi:hypothetical protein
MKQLMGITLEELLLLGDNFFMVTHLSFPEVLEQFKLVGEDFYYWDSSSEKWGELTSPEAYFPNCTFYMVIGELE